MKLGTTDVRRSFRTAALVAMLSALPLGSAFAASAEGSWSLADLPNGKIIYSTEADGAGLAFGCSTDGRLTAFVNIDGADMTAKMVSEAPETRTKPGKLSVGDGEADKTKWTYLPDLQVMTPVHNKITRRLYNAAITGEPVKLELRYMDNIKVTPPAIDDTFKTFSSSCKETSGA